MIVVPASPSRRVPGGRPGGGPGLLPFLRLSIHTMPDGGGRAGDPLLPLLVLQALQELTSTIWVEMVYQTIMVCPCVLVHRLVVTVWSTATCPRGQVGEVKSRCRVIFDPQLTAAPPPSAPTNPPPAQGADGRD